MFKYNYSPFCHARYIIDICVHSCGNYKMVSAYFIQPKVHFIYNIAVLLTNSNLTIHRAQVYLLGL